MLLKLANLHTSHAGSLKLPAIFAFAISVFALAFPTLAAIDPAMGPRDMGHASAELDQWQRIDLRSSGLPGRNTAQIKVAIRTQGPSMQGLIRIPGAPASNFDTDNGLTVVDLINVGNDSSGYADIVALEILFTQTMPGQFYEVFAVDDVD
ncbi:hypothetical protein EI171_23600 [Bradyrhizobium sp. LCT2]|uniref:hypothetical protein n=1 Tax=Bradyrhizobium sp. LCT2 TaxID=2493093 RepID=UPI0013743E40|nr:hypothetical protein [Bradyrhizobium sp. LCT2]QHP70015.1 hypothetical protein EI171_23600 [Bradyrhizobium sp. LCT2]